MENKLPDYISEYHEQIKSGKVTVGKHIKRLYKYIEKGLKDKKFYFSAEKADKAIRFIEEFCHHCETREDLIKLELWQKALISLIFGIVDVMGVRQYREIFIVIGRKNGKTLLASAIMAYVAYIDGDYGAKIYCLAPKLEQARIAYDNFYQMIQKEPELAEVSEKRRNDIYIEEYNTSIRPLAFNAKKSDGFNPSLVVNDEIASWNGDGGLKQYEVMKSALGARLQPLIISISTAGYLNNGIYDELFKRGTAVLNGTSKETRFLPIFYTIDDESKWDDLNELRKANPNMGVSVQESFFVEEIAIARNSLSKKAEFLTKYCNIKQSSSVAWLRSDVIEKVFGTPLSLEDFKGCYCVGGIDLSQTTDLTAACVVIEKNGKLYIFIRFFMPKNKITELQEREGVPYQLFVEMGLIMPSGENYVDYHDCFNWFRMLVEEYEILPLKVGYDRYSSQFLVQEMDEYGFHMDDVVQGENLSPVLREFEGMVSDGAFCGGDNQLLKAHFYDAAIAQNLQTRKIRLIKLNQLCHIDGLVSVIDAMTVRQKWHSEIGERLRNED